MKRISTEKHIGSIIVFYCNIYLSCAFQDHNIQVINLTEEIVKDVRQVNTVLKKGDGEYWYLTWCFSHKRLCGSNCM